MQTTSGIHSCLTVFIVIVLTVGCALAEEIVYVDDNAAGTNTGQSWQDALNYLQDALMIARPGDRILVAQGVYHPDDFVLSDRPSLGRRETFHLKNGVTIEGGYAGVSDPEGHDVDLHETILSGDLHDNDIAFTGWNLEQVRVFVEHESRSENSYSVVTTSDTDPTAVLDGVTITGGNSNKYLHYASGDNPPIPDGNCEPGEFCIVDDSPENNGAGMYNNAGSPTVVNCTFRLNTTLSFGADNGGAGVFSVNGQPGFEGCLFVQNISFTGDAACHGAGMFNVESDCGLVNCTFDQNWTCGFDSEYYGGGMYNLCSNPVLSDCRFIENVARYSFGGGIYNKRSNPVLNGCTFSSNSAEDGGGMVNEQSAPTLTSCIFNANTAQFDGGAMDNTACRAIVSNCQFVDNSARDGGAINSDYRCSETIAECTFTGNAATSGGAIFADGAINRDPESNTTITHSLFESNSANRGGAINVAWNRFFAIRNTRLAGNLADEGGAIHNYRSDIRAVDCEFTANRASNSGAAIAIPDAGDLEVSNCLFTGNMASHSGGAITGSFCSVAIRQSTLSGNRADFGSAIYVSLEPRLLVESSIVWGNVGSGGSQIYHSSPYGDDETSFAWNNIQGGYDSITSDGESDIYWGPGNTDLDPLFVDAGHWAENGALQEDDDYTWVAGDYHLRSQAGRFDAAENWIADEVTSPCIDAADPATPIGYEPFANGGIVNMGAYSGTPQASKSYFGGPPCKIIIAGDINGDCSVNLADIALLSRHWLEEGR